MCTKTDGTIIIYLYIDDMLCVGDKKALNIFKKEIKEHFVTKEEGKVDNYVGFMIKRNNDGILLQQSELRKLSFILSKKPKTCETTGLQGHQVKVLFE